jgi:hypothetical protein
MHFLTNDYASKAPLVYRRQATNDAWAFMSPAQLIETGVRNTGRVNRNIVTLQCRVLLRIHTAERLLSMMTTYPRRSA